jgi:hypothetical protein
LLRVIVPLVTGSLLVAISCGGDAKDPKKAAPQDGGTAQAPPDPNAADLVLLGGTIVTMGNKAPKAEAIAIKDGSIIAIGARADVEGAAGTAARTIDLQGGTCTPGLHDAHAHLTGLGKHLEEVDLRGASSIPEVIERIKQQAPKSGWITGRGWDQNLWPDQAMPTHQPLTDAFPDRHVWLRRIDGHAGWANQKVMEAAAVTAETEDPKGGEFLRDEEGLPTGVFVDTAMGVVPVPEPTAADLERWILAGQQHVLERGITGVHDMGVSSEVDVIYRRLASANEEQPRLKIRLVGYADVGWFEEELMGKREPDAPEAADLYGLTGVKAYADGALGSRGAALLAAYSDRPGHKGKLIRTLPEMEKVATEAMGQGWQVATHAIGDRGNRMVLDAYERAFQRHRSRDHRFRIEHAQIMHPEDIPRFAKVGVIASMQPTHATSDMPWVPDRIGDTRLAGAYAWRRFLKSGAHLTFGSDFPVERADITHGLYAAITRQNAEGQPADGWLPDQRVDLDEAIRGFSSEAAYAARRDQHFGTLEKDMQADLTCFVADIYGLSPTELRDAAIRLTIVRGEVMYEAP